MFIPRDISQKNLFSAHYRLFERYARFLGSGLQSRFEIAIKVI